MTWRSRGEEALQCFKTPHLDSLTMRTVDQFRTKVKGSWALQPARALRIWKLGVIFLLYFKHLITNGLLLECACVIMFNLVCLHENVKYSSSYWIKKKSALVRDPQCFISSYSLCHSLMLNRINSCSLDIVHKTPQNDNVKIFLLQMFKRNQPKLNWETIYPQVLESRLRSYFYCENSFSFF